jgi:hypothetical protein
MTPSQETPKKATPVRWIARAAAALLIGFLALFMVGNGGLPNVLTQPGPVQLESLGLVTIVVGAVLGWWREIVGGALSLVGFVLFCAVELAVNGSLPGGAIPLFCIPGIALIVSGLLNRDPTRSVAAS